MPIKSKLPDVDIPNIPFHDLMINHLQKYGTETALINYDTDETFTFADIISKTQYIANSLISLGIEKGEAVILCVPNSPDFVWLFLGISMAGCTVCPLYPTFSMDEMRLQISDSFARLAFVTPSALTNISSVFRELDQVHRIICVGKREESDGYPIISDLAFGFPTSSNVYPETIPDQDIVFLPYSTGTSGPHKGVAITHYALNAMLTSFNNSEAYEVTGHGDCTVGRMCFQDQFGRDALFSSLMNGTTVVITNQSDDVLVECLFKYRVRFLFLSPMVLKQLCAAVSNSSRQLTHLKTIAIGTAAPDDVLMKLAYKCLPSVKSYCSVYGMTEVGTICRSTKSSSYNIHSCGSLCANLSMKIIDLLCSEEVGPFERGLMLIKGPSVNSPYWNNEQATNEDFKYGGWRNTGDLGYYDRNGNVFLVDRVKQMIKVDGYQVTPHELETVLLTHPSVAEAAVVPLKVSNEYEMPFAFVVLRPKTSANPEEIREYVNSRVNPHKRLARVVIVLTIPRSPCGRILRRMLRETALLYS